MKDDDIVVSGMGVVTSIGYNITDFMDNIYEGKTHYLPHKQIKDTQSIRHLVAYASDKELVREIDLRKARKLDRFCLLALQAFRQSYENSGLEDERAQEFGIFLGNSSGGWSYVEPQLDKIYSGNYDDLSPYVATAWFPTAAQGEISIKYKISGYSKTFSANSLSVGYAIDHAIYLIKNNYLPGAFVGGVESPLSPLVYNACVHSQKVSLSGSYSPFSKYSDGCLLGEGAGIFSLEKYQNIEQRKQSALAKVAGIGIASSLSASIRNCLSDAEKKPDEVDCIFLDAKGSEALDNREINELESIFLACGNTLLTTTKPLHGHLLDADFAVELIVAAQTLNTQKVPCGLRSENDPQKPGFGKLVVDGAIQSSLNNVLVYTCNPQGSSISVLLEKIDS